MTKSQTMAAIKALGLTARHTEGEYRISYTTAHIAARHSVAGRSTAHAYLIERAEAVAYYTDDAGDALGTARHMAAQGYQA